MRIAIFWFLIAAGWLTASRIEAATPADPKFPATDRYGDSLPEGCLFRLGTVRFRPGPHSVSAVSPDGKLFATAELEDYSEKKNRHVTLWDMVSGLPLASIEMPDSKSIHLLHFRTDGKQLAVAVSERNNDDNRLYLIDIAARRLVEGADKKLLSFAGTVSAIAHFDAEKGLLIQGATKRIKFPDDEPDVEKKQDEEPKPHRHQNAPILLWKPDTDKVISLYDKEEEFFPGPDGRVISVSEKKIRLLDPETRRVVGEWDRPSRAAFPIGATTDGKKLAVLRPMKPSPSDGGLNNQFVICERGKQPLVFKENLSAEQAEELAARWRGLPLFTPDGRLMIHLETHHQQYYQLSVWSLDNQEQLWSHSPIKIDQYLRHSFSPDSRSIAVVDNLGLSILDARTGKTKVRREHGLLHGIMGPRSEPSHIQWTLDGKTLIVIGVAVQFLDAKTLDDQSSFQGPGGATLAVKYSANQRWITTIGSDNRLTVWDRATGKPIKAPDAVKVQRQSIWPIEWPSESPHERVWKFVFVNGGDLLASVAEERLRLFDCAAGKSILDVSLKSKLASSEEKDPLRSFGIAFSPDGCRLAAAIGERLDIWDIRLGKRIDHHALDEKMHEPFVNFSIDGRFVFAHDCEKSKYWNMSDGKETAIPPDHGLWGPSFSADGNRFAFIENKTVVWDLVRGKEVLSLEIPWQLGMNQCRFSPSGNRLALVDPDGSLRSFDTATGREIYVVPPKANDSIVYMMPGEPQHKFVGELRIHRSEKKDLDEEELRLCSRLVDLETGRTIIEIPPVYWDVSSDGRVLAYGHDNITLVEMATAKELGTIPGKQGGVSTVTFSPDRRTLAVGGKDTTTLIWDWAKAIRLPPNQPVPSGAAWADLTHADPKIAFGAMLALRESPEATIMLFQKELKPATKEDEQQISEWIKQLDDDRFAVRERARRELTDRGQTVGPMFEAKSKEKRPPETENQIRLMLESFQKRRFSPQELRQLRAIQVLEWINNKESRSLLAELAKGASSAFKTREAAAALSRFLPIETKPK